MSPPPRTTAAIGTGSLVRRRAAVAVSITVDHDATEVAKGTVARFHGSSESGMTVKIWSPGLSRNQPPAKPASRMGERLEASVARQARVTPAPRTTAPGRTFIRRTSGPIVSCYSPKGNGQRVCAGDRSSSG